MTAKSDKSQETTEQSNLKAWHQRSRPRILVLLAVVVIIAFILAYSSWASAPGGNFSNGNKVQRPNLTMVPASQEVPLSSPLAIKVWADTNGQKVNAVELNISYPIDKLNFVSIDTTGSAFGLTVQGSGGDGKVTIARGSFQPIKGKLLVATVNFSGANSVGQAAVSFVSGTSLIGASDNKDILAVTYGGTYTLTQ